MKNGHQKMPNKANSLGQSKASLRSVLPTGDLQRYILKPH